MFTNDIISYLKKPFTEFCNIGHVKNKVYGRIDHQHEMSKINTIFDMNVGFTNPFRIVSCQQAHQLVNISNNWEKLTKYKYNNHSNQNFCLLANSAT